jgi:hypothetical protein
MTVLYWVHDDTCKDPLTDGYIGVTEYLDQRTRMHRKKPALNLRRQCKDVNLCDITILFEGSRMECLHKEAELRPHKSIGWNHTRGGAGSGTVNAMRPATITIKVSPEQKQAYQKQADTEKRLLSDWVRLILDAEVASRSKKNSN